MGGQQAGGAAEAGIPHPHSGWADSRAEKKTRRQEISQRQIDSLLEVRKTDAAAAGGLLGSEPHPSPA